MDKVIFFIKQFWQSKTIYRAFFNRFVFLYCGNLLGKTVDLAGGGGASYYDFLKNKDILRTNFYQGKDVDLVVDLDKKLPFNNDEFDNVLFFNAVYIVKDVNLVFNEIKRVLKPGGRCFLSSPFVANEMPEPHDFRRLTGEGIENIIIEAGFSDFKIYRMGERFTSAVYLLDPFFYFKFVKIAIYFLAMCLDKIIPKKIKKAYPTPLGYFVIIKK